jgi:hypothetical protein
VSYLTSPAATKATKLTGGVGVTTGVGVGTGVIFTVGFGVAGFGVAGIGVAGIGVAGLGVIGFAVGAAVMTVGLADGLGVGDGDGTTAMTWLVIGDVLGAAVGEMGGWMEATTTPDTMINARKP